MIGKILIVMLLLGSVLAGGGLYYLQVYHYYEEVKAETVEVSLTSVSSGMPEIILAENVKAIDAASSPIRFRACFTTPMDHALLSETYVLRDDAEPLTAPVWFDCFDADQIGSALEDGTALAFTGQENIAYGVDSVVAIFDDGRGFVWHQINNCGQKAYDGTATGPECPSRESFESN